MNITYVKGDLIGLSKTGHYDVIVHGCNCFNTQTRGIAKDFASAFRTADSTLYRLEQERFKGDINKLGQIEFKHHTLDDSTGQSVTVINAYTQYRYGTAQINVDYDALRLCLRKINHRFRGKHIGMPAIGSGLAGGDWAIIERIIQQEMADCLVDVILFEKKRTQIETNKQEENKETVIK